MKVAPGNKEYPIHPLRYLGKRILFVLGLILLVLVCINLRLIVSTMRFFYMMGKIPALGETREPYPLDDLKHIALFLSEQSEQDRRRLIMVYNAYAQTHHDHPRTAFKLFILLRLLFSVPQEYPINDALFFGGWRGQPPREPLEGEMFNLLWPLEYQNGQLVLKVRAIEYKGLPYDGLGEYDYFASRFLLRSADDLK